MHPSERLECFLTAENMNYSDFADLAGISKNGSNKYSGKSENGKTKSVIGRKSKEKIDNIGLNFNWYQTGEGNMYSEKHSFGILALKYKNNKDIVDKFFNKLLNHIETRYGGLKEYCEVPDTIKKEYDKVKSVFEIKDLNDNDIFYYFSNEGLNLRDILNSVITESLTGNISKENVYNQDVNVSELNTPFYKDIFNKFLNLPVYDLPAHALLGVGQSYEDLPMSFKPLNIGIKLDAETVKLFRVTGDSMIDSHILSGAYIVVDTFLKPVNGCKILANHNGILIVKYCEIVDGKLKLYSLNGGIHDYDVSSDDYLSVIGVVRAVLNYM